MHFIEVFFFEQFLIRSFSFLGDDDSFVKFIFDASNLLFELLAFDVLLRDGFEGISRESFFDLFVPFLLELIECICHFMFDEEVSKEEIDCLSIAACFSRTAALYFHKKCTELMFCGGD